VQSSELPVRLQGRHTTEALRVWRRPNGTPASDQDMVQIGEHDERRLVATMVAAPKTYYGDNNVTFT
jgi:hypothetical protein